MVNEWEDLPDLDVSNASWGATTSGDDGIIEDGNAIIDDKMYKQFIKKNTQTIANILEVGLPMPGEQIRLITMNSFNASAFIQFIAEKETISELILVVFAINLQAAQMLIDLKKEGKIKGMELVVSSIRNAGYSIKSKAVELLAGHSDIKMCFVNSHAKISALRTEKGSYYIIEGSGNYSYNGRIEQYVIDNSEQLFIFTKDWIREMKKSMRLKKDFKVIN